MVALSKKNQISKDWLEEHSPIIYTGFQPWLDRFFKDEFSSQEITAIFILLFYSELFGLYWYEGLQYKTLEKNIKKSKILIKHILPETENTDRLKQIAQMTLDEFFINCRIHKFPKTCQELMKNWFKENFSIHIEFTILDPLSLLKLQTQGKRVVWLPRSLTDLFIYHEGKDPLEFVQHDLEHAYNFFVKFSFYEQIEFYKSLLHNITLGKFEKRISEDEKFKSEIEYLMSDMNSHPEHLKATLKALLENSN